ncbi:MAG: DUF4351 domain-containing protein [Leptolyngbyaceae cyanobacterium]
MDHNRAEYDAPWKEFIDWLIDLPEPLETIFQQELAQFEEERTMRYISTIEQQGIEQGLEQGLEQGERSLILRQLRRCVGELSEFSITPINQLSACSVEEFINCRKGEVPKRRSTEKE